MPCLGVVGTLVWDTIVPHGAGVADYVGWGGITYALEALEATLDPSWEVLPIVKVGSDLADDARSLLGRYRSVRSLDGLIEVAEPNNRVELRYSDPKTRRETLSGGVPGWSWEEIRPLADRCDALYVNFIAGWEVDLATAESLGHTFEGPTYIDVHSLVLAVEQGGERTRRVVEGWPRWIGSFDVAQLNDGELASLGGTADPWSEMIRVFDRRTSALFVTKGREAVEYVACDPAGIQPFREAKAGPCPWVRGQVEVQEAVVDPDPTGCGDVWGAVCFGTLLAGSPIEQAIREANRAAAEAARHRGAVGLASSIAEPAHSEGNCR